MANDKYVENRKIIYECAYCGNQYVNLDSSQKN